MPKFRVHSDCQFKVECAFAPSWDTCVSCTGPLLSDEEVSQLRGDANEAARAKLARIKDLELNGVLGPELCPEPDYWHWAIHKPEELPEEFAEFLELGEVRF